VIHENGGCSRKKDNSEPTGLNCWPSVGHVILNVGVESSSFQPALLHTRLCFSAISADIKLFGSPYKREDMFLNFSV